MAERPLVIALNGPPGVGKDTLAEALLSSYKTLFTQLSVKEPLLETASKDPEYGSIIAHVWAPGANHALKDAPYIFANGQSLTPRAMLIQIATRLRNQYGDGYFARKAVEKILKMSTERAIVVTDVGFECELKELEMHCDVVLVRMEREGCTFANDSRTYLPLRGMHFTLSNNSNIQTMKDCFLNSLAKALAV